MKALPTGAVAYKRTPDFTEDTTPLRAGGEGVIEPRVPHEVELDGPVRFYVEFLRAGDV